MKAAVKSVKITPPLGLPIGGNIRSDNISRGTHDDLYCNLILLANGTDKYCFINFDLLGLHYEACSEIKAAIQAKTGINSKKIIISTTHTHSGPDVLDIFKDEISSECLAYISTLRDSISEAAKLMLTELFDAKMYFSKNQIFDLSFNRRLFMKNGPMKMNWEEIDLNDFIKEAGPIDPALGVISICDSNDKIKGLIVNFTLHPAVLVGKDWLWSRDYINYLDLALKEKYGSDITLLFANGAEGNINHVNFKDKNIRRGFEETERIGRKLAQYVIEALEKGREAIGDYIDIKSKVIKLPLRQLSDQEIKNAKKLIKETGDIIPSLLDGVPDEVYAREIVKLTKFSSKYVETEIQVAKLGNEVLIATFPGEVFTEFGMRVKDNSNYKNTMIFGLTNDFIGYIPTQEAFKQGGYEIKTAGSSKLDQMAGDMLVTEVLQLVKSL